MTQIGALYPTDPSKQFKTRSWMACSKETTCWPHMTAAAAPRGAAARRVRAWTSCPRICRSNGQKQGGTAGGSRARRPGAWIRKKSRSRPSAHTLRHNRYPLHGPRRSRPAHFRPRAAWWIPAQLFKDSRRGARGACGWGRLHRMPSYRPA